MAHQVLLELDEAGADYFALAIREPASSKYLVKTPDAQLVPCDEGSVVYSLLDARRLPPL